MAQKALVLISYLMISLSLFSQSAEGGGAFYEKMRVLPFEEREVLIKNELLSGNMPSFILNFVPVTFARKDTNGKNREVTIFVSPDYLSVGDADDYFIIPITPQTAQSVAESFNASLPTPLIVDIVYSNSELKLEPFNFIPRGNRNETPDILYDHSKIIQAQMKAAGYKPGTFVAGTKKDIVVSSKLSDTVRTRHVTIYGWHRLNGKAIQPLSNIHIDSYVDYSHGARLISNNVIIDGEEYYYSDVLKDSLLHTLLSNEKYPLTVTAYRNH